MTQRIRFQDLQIQDKIVKNNRAKLKKQEK